MAPAKKRAPSPQGERDGLSETDLLHADPDRMVRRAARGILQLNNTKPGSGRTRLLLIGVAILIAASIAAAVWWQFQRDEQHEAGYVRVSACCSQVC